MIWDQPAAEELLLWLSPYRIVAVRPDGPFVAGDTALSQTLALRAPSGLAGGRMENGSFLQVGYDLGDHLPGDELHVKVGAEAATWSVGSRRFVAAPPLWQVQGEHAGVYVDLEMSAMGPPMWITDPSLDIETTMERWFVQCARARGQVRFAGKEYQIDGYASHERHVHCGTRYDPPKLLDGRGVTWHSGSGRDVQLIALSRPSLGLSWARLVFDDEVYDFNSPNDRKEIEETDHWIDPESRLRVPSAWRCHFEGRSGSLEVTARAHRRAYYLWPNFKFGCTVLYWWLASADVSWSLPSRGSGSERFQYVVHDNRLLYRQHWEV
jgi:hypothetical protein